MKSARAEARSGSIMVFITVRFAFFQNIPAHFHPLLGVAQCLIEKDTESGETGRVG
jgi:hypothetical protein